MSEENLNNKTNPQEEATQPSEGEKSIPAIRQEMDATDTRELREEERDLENGDLNDQKAGQLSFKLEKFEGPLDLLLHLIDKNKVDIYDIPIAEITDQYMDYVNKMQEEDLNVMSEFLVMAATLLDIKCRMLLPKEVNEEGEEQDPRDELVQKLLEYKVYKYMSQELRDRLLSASQNLYRKKKLLPREVTGYIPPINYDELLKGTTLAQLQDIFRDVIKKQKYRVDPVRSGFGKIEREEVDLSGKELYIKAYLNSHRMTDFRDLLERQRSREEIIVAFLVILELMKTGKIRVTQAELFGHITIETIGYINSDAGSASEFSA
ncbi:MAG: segregation and condensation protein A [Lachnospiraceae bacterium]